MLDLDAWEDVTEPVARRLCTLAPWEWREWCDRSTVGEIEARVRDAIYARAEYAGLLSWQTAKLMNATGALKRPVKAQDLVEELATYTRDPRTPGPDPQQMAEHSAAVMEAAAAAGFGVVGQMTPEELEEARRGATVDRGD